MKIKGYKFLHKQHEDSNKRKILKHLVRGVVLIALVTSCSEDIIMDGYKVKTVDIEIDNYNVGIAEGTKKIDVDEDGNDDLGLGLGYHRSDTMLESYFFGIEALDTNIFIAASEFLDTLYECKPTQGAGSAKTTTFNALSPFICNDSMFLEEVETNSEFYPTIFDSNEIESTSINWSNDKLTMARCEKRISEFSGKVSIVHDFWV